jgi:hypothetical protein
VGESVGRVGELLANEVQPFRAEQPLFVVLRTVLLIVVL